MQTSTPTSVAVVGNSSPVAIPVVVASLDWAVIIPLIFAGLALLITTFFSAFGIYQNRKIEKTSKENGAKADAIHVLVNSGMSKALSDLALAQEEIRTLRDAVATLNSRIIGDASLTERQRVAARNEELVTQTAADNAKLPSESVMAAKARTPWPNK